MTHLWMKLTKGNKGPDGGEDNLQLLANLLCDIAGYDLPLPRVFGDERLRLLKSAVGDSSGTSATAVGVASTPDPDALLAAAAVGRTAESNGGSGTHQPSPPGPQGQPSPPGGVLKLTRPLRISGPQATPPPGGRPG